MFSAWNDICDLTTIVTHDNLWSFHAEGLIV